MAKERAVDFALTLVCCVVAMGAPNDLIRVAAIFAAGWHASWAIQGETR